jgi:hypothetical protein
MAVHSGRLILTALFLIFLVTGLFSNSPKKPAAYWGSALFWALMAIAVGYPFVRGGKIDLNYDDAPIPVVFEGARPAGY